MFTRSADDQLEKHLIESESAVLAAIKLLLTGDQAVWSIIGVSFAVSLRAVLIASPFALCIAFFLAYKSFTGRRFLLTLVNTLMSVPTVVVGLTIYLVLSRNGIGADLHLLFTQTAMIIGQVLICTPLIIAIAHSTFQSGDQKAYETAKTLGASPLASMLTVIKELRFGLLAALIAGFSRIIAEVGCSMMVGGNILDRTRNIPTAIALETSKGEFVIGIALGIVLVSLTMMLNIVLNYFQGSGEIK